MATGIKLNTKDFKAGLTRISLKQVLPAAKKGMGMAALQLMGDCIMVEPTVPLKTGRTRASGTAFTQNKLVGDSKSQNVPRQGMSAGQPTPDESFRTPIPSHSIVGIVVFNTDYAWNIHERRPVDWQLRRATPFHEPGADIKWMETKMIAFAKNYFGIIGAEIKKTIGK